MSSKRAQRRKACTGKQRYATQADALAAIKALVRSKGGQGWLVPYHCAFCGGYHYGHAPAKVRQAILARREAVR